jgi:2-hydroxy-3-oxopropionate reductase
MAATDDQGLAVGFIGLGIMGLPMATNLLQAGHRLAVNTRTRSRAESLLEAGAAWAAEPSEVARRSDVVITMLPDSPDVAAVVDGEAGLLAGARAGTTWIDMSSISPSVAKRLADRAAEHGVDCLDAPVSGGEIAAVSGSLTIMVGGPEAVFVRCRPLLECMGSTVRRVGDAGAGQVAKVCNQMIVGITIAAVAESLVLGAKAGVDPAMIREALLGGFAQSRVLDVHGQRMLEGSFAPGFRVDLHAKDMANAMDSARSYGASAPLSALVGQLMNSLVATGGADLDHSALARVYEAQAAGSLAG